MIEAHGLVKRYGSATAVDDLSFSIRPGLVTGFLGPNCCAGTGPGRSAPRSPGHPAATRPRAANSTERHTTTGPSVPSPWMSRR